MISSMFIVYIKHQTSFVVFQKRDGTVAGATRRSLSAQFTGEFSVLNSFITVQFPHGSVLGKYFPTVTLELKKKLMLEE